VRETEESANIELKAYRAITNKKYRKAQKLLAKIDSLEDTESRIVARNNLGTAYEKMKELEKAMTLYQANLEEGAHTPHCYIRLAIYYEKMKEYQEALDVVNKFLEVIENLPKSYGVWGSSGTEKLQKRRIRLLEKIEMQGKSPIN